MTQRANKIVSWGIFGLGILWLALGGLDITVDLHRGRDIAAIEIVVVLGV